MATAWRFLDTGCNDAVFNMAVDEALLLSYEAGQSPPTLRVYTWFSPTLSLGYAQNVEKEIDVAACRQHGVTLVRRPTGGRAVLHDQEATYSVVMPLRLADREASITEHYHRIGVALAAALRHAGLAVRLERPSVLAAAPRSASPACFAAMSRYELSATGRKLVGSAQKRGRRSLLQHGSIPLSMDRQRLFACLRVPADRRAPTAPRGVCQHGSGERSCTRAARCRGAAPGVAPGFRRMSDRWRRADSRRPVTRRAPSGRGTAAHQIRHRCLEPRQPCGVAAAANGEPHGVA